MIQERSERVNAKQAETVSTSTYNGLLMGLDGGGSRLREDGNIARDAQRGCGAAALF